MSINRMKQISPAPREVGLFEAVVLAQGAYQERENAAVWGRGHRRRDEGRNSKAFFGGM